MPALARKLVTDSFTRAANDDCINGGSCTRTKYAYAWNDPLKYVDPSGHSLLGDIIGIIVAIVAIYLMQPELFYGYGSLEASTAFVAGFAGGFVGALVSTGSLSAALTAGIIGAITGAAFYEAGTFAQWASKAGPEWGYAAGVLSHAAVGCFQGVASGGNCGKGALAAAVSEAAGPLEKSAAQWGGPAAGVAAAGIVGGAAARAVGGSFNDGFSVAAAGYLFNEIAHEIAREQKIAELSAKLSNAQVAATLKFFNYGDATPYTAADLDGADQSVVTAARRLAATYIVSGTWAAQGIGTVDKFAKPPTGYWGLLWESVKAAFGFESPQYWTWSTDIPKLQGQLTDRFGSGIPGTIRSTLSSAYQEQYFELKNGT